MTNKDPSREAFEAWIIQDRRNRNIALHSWTDEELKGVFLCDSKREWEAWQAALAIQMPNLHPGVKFEDSRVQVVYDILCSFVQPPADEHWEGFTARRIVDALAAPADAVEPVAWRDPKNTCPGQGCTYNKADHEKWPHIYRQPLYAAPTTKAETCSHRIADIRNAVVKSGYMCIDCGALFSAADHDTAKATQGEKP